MLVWGSMLPPGFPPRKPGSLILGKIISPGFHLRRRYLTEVFASRIKLARTN